METSARAWWFSTAKAQVENDGALLRLWNRGERLFAPRGSGAIVLSGRRAELAVILINRLTTQYASAEEQGSDRAALVRDLGGTCWREMKTILGIVGEMPTVGAGS
jgi:hypothetical protein